MIHSIFQFCVQLLLAVGRAVGAGFEALHVLIFVFLWPVLPVGLLVALCWRRLLIRRLEKLLKVPTRGELYR